MSEMTTLGSAQDGEDKLRNVNGLTALRRANLAKVLRLVNSDGPMSRAELTAAMGLNRLTVRDLVSELQALGFLAEASGIQTGRTGRPIRKLRLDNDRLAVATVELRRDYVQVGAATLASELLFSVRRDVDLLNRDPGIVLARAAMLLREVEEVVRDEGYDLVQVAVGCPAIVDRDAGVVLTSGVLPWSNVPVVDILRDQSDFQEVEFSLSRLTNLAIKAEQRRNPQLRASGVALLFNDVDVGIGGAFQRAGNTFEGDFDSGTQFGHVTVDVGGRDCFCGRRGCLEQYVGIGPLLESLGLEEGALDSVLERMAEGDAEVQAAVRSQSEWLARSLDILTATFGPREIVLGGLLAPMLPILSTMLDEHNAEILPLGSGPKPLIRASTLGMDAVQQGGFIEAVEEAIQRPWQIEARIPGSSSSQSN
jgi:predicted NBD/HSP70 family sugar kinase